MLLVATGLHPAGADPGDPAAAFAEYAADRLWVGSHLGQFAGLALMLGGLCMLSRTLEAGRGAGCARLGRYAAVAALAAGAALQAVDGVALKASVDRWAALTGTAREAAFAAAFAVRQIETGLAAYLTTLLGVATILLGVAMARSGAFAAWSGWFGIVAGAASLASGVMTAFQGFRGAAMDASMAASLLLIGWVVCTAVLMWRRSAARPADSNA